MKEHKDPTLTFIGGPLNGAVGACTLARALDLDPEMGRHFGISYGNIIVAVYERCGCNTALFLEEPPKRMKRRVTDEVVVRIRARIEEDR